MGETLHTAPCPRCGHVTLHATRGTVTACQVCGYLTTGGLVTVPIVPKRINRNPLDEVAP